MPLKLQQIKTYHNDILQHRRLKIITLKKLHM